MKETQQGPGRGALSHCFQAITCRGQLLLRKAFIQSPLLRPIVSFGDLRKGGVKDTGPALGEPGSPQTSRTIVRCCVELEKRVKEGVGAGLFAFFVKWSREARGRFQRP